MRISSEPHQPPKPPPRRKRKVSSSKASECRRSQHILPLYVSHAAKPIERQWMENHLKSCTPCAQLYIAYLTKRDHLSFSHASSKTTAIVNQWLIGKPGPTAPPPPASSKRFYWLSLVFLFAILLGSLLYISLSDELIDSNVHPTETPEALSQETALESPLSSSSLTEPPSSSETRFLASTGPVPENLKLKLQSYEWLLYKHHMKKRRTYFSPITYVIVRGKTRHYKPRILHRYAKSVARQYHLSEITGPKKLNLSRLLPKTSMFIGTKRGAHLMLSALQKQGDLWIAIEKTRWKRLKRNQKRIIIHFSNLKK